MHAVQSAVHAVPLWAHLVMLCRGVPLALLCSRNDAACAMAVAAAGEGALLDLHAAAAAAPKKVVDEEEEDEKEAAEGASDGAAGKCSLGSAAGRARAPWLFGLGTAAAHRLSHIFSSSVRRR